MHIKFIVEPLGVVRPALMLPAICLMLSSCGNAEAGREATPWGADAGESAQEGAAFDLDKIQGNGELIMLTLSGPEYCYDYRGKHLGTHFLLCQRFADKIGVALRVEVCRDTVEMFRRLDAGEGDVIAFPVPPSFVGGSISGGGAYILCGPSAGRQSARWVVTSSQPQLAKALDAWFRPALLGEVEREERLLLGSRSVRRHVYSPMKDRRRGVISSYDALFVEHSRKIRWDWRLLAAQCYQESTFDPEAKSWAGACGLMQIMPSTASRLGLSYADLFVPEDNIEAATRFLGQLEGRFSDIADRRERLSFVLASYNGGYHHIRDAMRLASKHGRDGKSWREVSQYVLLLSDPRYYRDPVVEYGYMRGSETVDYVSKVMQRWRQYEGVGRPAAWAGFLEPRKATRKKPKYKLAPPE